MRLPLGLFVFVSCSACSLSPNTSHVAIYGGQGVSPEHFAARSVVALTLSDGQRVCSGTYLGGDTVLTAAHCIVPYHDLPLFVEFRGLPSPIPLKIRESRYHAGYVGGNATWSTHPTSPYNDVALSFFEGEVPPQARASLLVPDATLDAEPLLAGYGETGNDRYRGETLNMATVTRRMVFSGAAIVCLTGGTRESCTTPRPLSRVGACSGDSGGAIFNGDGRLAGIISYIDDSCDQGLTFGVMVAAYRNWIARNSGLDLATGTRGERTESEAVRVFHTGFSNPAIDFSLLGPFAPVEGWPGFLCADYRDGRARSVWYEVSTGKEYATGFEGRCASWAR